MTVTSWTIVLTPNMPILCGHVQVYTLGRLSIDGFSFERVAQFNLEWIFSKLDSGFQSLVRFRILSAGFRIPKPRIPDPTSKKFLDSGIRSPLHGAKFFNKWQTTTCQVEWTILFYENYNEGCLPEINFGSHSFYYFHEWPDECTLFTYADNTQLFKSAENIDQVEHAINAELMDELN